MTVSDIKPEQTNNVSSFLKKINAHICDIDTERITKLDLVPMHLPRPFTTRFGAHYDTLLFLNLINRLLKMIAPNKIDYLIDLGAGSCIPTIRALTENPQHAKLKVTAVENDEGSIKMARANVAQYNFGSRFDFVHADMLDFIKKDEMNGQFAIVSNPPYLPVSADIKDQRFESVNGGESGAKYLTPILCIQLPKGTYVAIAWSSLSDPSRVIALIEKQYNVLFAHVQPITKGIYTENSILKPHILRQKNMGMAECSINNEGHVHWKIIGTILKRK